MPPEDVNNQAEAAIEKRNQQADESRMTISKLVEKRAVELYDDTRAQEFVSALIAASERSPRIKQCNPTSVIAAMMACIMLDLTPETNQQFAYLIPYGNNIQFQIGYKGLIELAYRSGMVSSINAELVFPDDQFEFELGTNRTIKHVPNMDRDRTKWDDVTHVYATAMLMDGRMVFDVMNVSEINKIRETVKAKSTDAPWRTWPEQMAKKTIIKRLMKYLPQSRKDNRVKDAALWDSWAEAGKLAYQDGKLVEGKIDTAPKEPPKKQLKTYAKPPAKTETKPEPQEAAPQTQAKETEDSQNGKSHEEYLTEINDMLDFLKLSSKEKMRIINQYTKPPILDKANTEALAKIHRELKDMAEAKTKILAEKENDGS